MLVDELVAVLGEVLVAWTRTAASLVATITAMPGRCCRRSRIRTHHQRVQVDGDDVKVDGVTRSTGAPGPVRGTYRHLRAVGARAMETLVRPADIAARRGGHDDPYAAGPARRRSPGVPPAIGMVALSDERAVAPLRGRWDGGATPVAEVDGPYADVGSLGVGLTDVRAGPTTVVKSAGVGADFRWPARQRIGPDAHHPTRRRPSSRV